MELYIVPSFYLLKSKTLYTEIFDNIKSLLERLMEILLLHFQVLIFDIIYYIQYLPYKQIPCYKSHRFLKMSS